MNCQQSQQKSQMTLNGLSDKELESLLNLNAGAERLLNDHIIDLPESVRRDSIRKSQFEVFSEVANRSKVDLVVSAEKTYLQAELKDFADGITLKTSEHEFIDTLFHDDGDGLTVIDDEILGFTGLTIDIA